MVHGGWLLLRADLIWSVKVPRTTGNVSRTCIAPSCDGMRIRVGFVFRKKGISLQAHAVKALPKDAWESSLSELCRCCYIPSGTMFAVVNAMVASGSLAVNDIDNRAERCRQADNISNYEQPLSCQPILGIFLG